MNKHAFLQATQISIALCLTAPSTGAALPAQSAGEVTQGGWSARFSADRGVSLSYQGVPVTRRSSLYIVKPHWSGLIYDYRAGKPHVTVTGETITATDENADVKIGYAVTLDGGTATTDFSYSLKHDFPCEIEYAAGFINGPLMADTSYTAQTAGGVRSGIIPYAPPVSDPENNRFVPSFQALTLGTRLGTLDISVAGDWPDFVCFDARNQSESWAREAPIFWMGLGVAPHHLRYAGGKVFHVITRYRFASQTLVPEAMTTQPASLMFPITASAQARVPQTVLPVVIPQPKTMTLTKTRLPLNRRTRLVVADDATAQEQEAARTVQRELNTRFGLANLAIVRAAAIRQPENVLIFGEPKRMPLIARLLTQSGTHPSAKAEGYALRVGPTWAVVAGHDPAGTFYGAQTLCQLIGLDQKGPFVWTAAVDDYPALSWRGAHLFVGNQALPFHKTLIQNVFSRVKMNNLVLQCEQAKWQTAGKSAPAWGMSKADLRRENTFAAQHFMAVTPLINSVGHMEWLFSDPGRTALAEDPTTPYAVNTANPDAGRFLFRLYDEALDVFHPKYMHIGADEVTLRGRYPYRSRSVYPTVADEFIAQVTQAHDYLKSRGVGTMIWGDMLLADGEAPDAANASTAAQAAQMRGSLPKDIVITDWHYTPSGDFPSPALFRKAGFASVIGSTWFNPRNIAVFSRVQAENRQRGLLQTTWAGFNSNARNLADDPAQFAAFVLAGDYAWTGANTPPDQLPYNPAHVFAAWYAPSRSDPRTRSGFTVDLSPLAERLLSDSPSRDGWLGYGPAHDLRRVPIGTRRFGDVLYHLSSGVILLHGGLNPAGTFLKNVTLPLNRPAATLSLLLCTAYAALPQTRVGTLSVIYADGTHSSAPLIYGRNIAAWNDTHDAPQASVAWSGETASNEPIFLRAFTWQNPTPDKTIRSVALTADDPTAAPALFALTGLNSSSFHRCMSAPQAQTARPAHCAGCLRHPARPLEATTGQSHCLLDTGCRTAEGVRY